MSPKHSGRRHSRRTSRFHSAARCDACFWWCLTTVYTPVCRHSCPFFTWKYQAASALIGVVQFVLMNAGSYNQSNGFETCSRWEVFSRIVFNMASSAAAPLCCPLILMIVRRHKKTDAFDEYIVEQECHVYKHPLLVYKQEKLRGLQDALENSAAKLANLPRASCCSGLVKPVLTLQRGDRVCVIRGSLWRARDILDDEDEFSGSNDFRLTRFTHAQVAIRKQDVGVTGKQISVDDWEQNPVLRQTPHERDALGKDNTEVGEMLGWCMVTTKDGTDVLRHSQRKRTTREQVFNHIHYHENEIGPWMPEESAASPKRRGPGPVLGANFKTRAKKATTIVSELFDAVRDECETADDVPQKHLNERTGKRFLAACGVPENQLEYSWKDIAKRDHDQDDLISRELFVECVLDQIDLDDGYFVDVNLPSPPLSSPSLLLVLLLLTVLPPATCRLILSGSTRGDASKSYACRQLGQ